MSFCAVYFKPRRKETTPDQAEMSGILDQAVERFQERDEEERETAKTLNVPFLGEIPIELALRQACDDGRPFVAEGGDSAASKAFLAMAERVLDTLDHTSLKPPPVIVFED